MSRKATRSAIPRQCLRCQVTFYPTTRQVKNGLGHYCSRQCCCNHRNRRPPPPMTLAFRFWRHVNKDGPLPANASLGPCWEWTGSLAGSGGWAYGKLGRSPGSSEKVIYAHRLSYELHVGPIPDGSLVCHTCDRPSCCNPSHLFLGTPAANTHDMCEKQRHPGLKMNWAKVREARARHATGESIRVLAEAYDVCRGTMSMIINHRIWKDEPQTIASR